MRDALRSGAVATTSSSRRPPTIAPRSWALGSAEEQPTVEGADDLGVGRLARSWRDVDPPALLEPADLEHADRPTVAMTRTREESRRVRPLCAEHIAHERPDDDPAPAVEAWLANEVVEADGLGVAGLLRVLVVGADLVA